MRAQRFIVDRQTYVPNTTREVPELIKTSAAYKTRRLKGYIARFNDNLEPQNIQNHNPKVITHLLPPYRPLWDDFITLLHALYMLHKRIPTEDVYHLFILHRPDGQPRLDLPASMEHHHRILPSMPYSLQNVYIASEEDDFVDGDRQQLAGIMYDFLDVISHTADPSWNAYLGQFASQPEMDDRRCESFIEFMWLFDAESAMIGAECVSSLEPQ